MSLEDLVDVAGDGAEIAPLGSGVDVDHRLHVVVRDDAGARPRVICASPPRYCGASVSWRRDRHVRQVRHAVDAVLRHLGDDRIGDAVFGVEPEIRLDLAAAGERDEQAVGDVALGQPDLVGKRAVDVDIDLRIVEHLLDAQVGDAGHLADALQQIGGIGVIGLLVVADDLHVDRRRQAEIQDLRDDVGRQEGEGRAREFLRQVRCAAALTKPAVGP